MAGIKKAIIITGTPGTGKTTFAKEFSSLMSYVYVDVNDVVSANDLDEGYDDERKCRVIDTDKLNKSLIALINASDKKLVIDSHLSHFMPKKYVDLCFVVKCDLKDLEKRLKKRGYHEEKVRENLDSEIFDTCRIEAVDAGHEIIIIDTSKSVRKKAMVFGTFDHTHKGHKFLMKKARSYADELIVVVGTDKNVFEYKGKMPDNDEKTRRKNVLKMGIADSVIVGSAENKLEPILKHRPDVICLGYDHVIKRDELKNKLADNGLFPEIIRIPAFRSDINNSHNTKKKKAFRI